MAESQTQNHFELKTAAILALAGATLEAGGMDGQAAYVRVLQYWKTYAQDVFDREDWENEIPGLSDVSGAGETAAAIEPIGPAGPANLS